MPDGCEFKMWGYPRIFKWSVRQIFSVNLLEIHAIRLLSTFSIKFFHIRLADFILQISGIKSIEQNTCKIYFFELLILSVFSHLAKEASSAHKFGTFHFILPLS